ncbi:MAG: hypothetical protein ACM30H_00195 [Clostridia bacterium]
MRISVLTTPEAGSHRPCAFHLGGRRVAVAAVLARWDDDSGRCYEVRDLEGRRFVLRQCSASGLWELAGVYGRRREAQRHMPAARATV